MILSEEKLKSGLAFSEKAGLMVKIKRMYESGKFNFRVINGEWEGSVDPSSNIMIVQTPSGDEKHTFINDFKNVLDLTKEEKDQWYVSFDYDTTLSAKKKIIPDNWKSEIPF